MNAPPFVAVKSVPVEPTPTPIIDVPEEPLEEEAVRVPVLCETPPSEAGEVPPVAELSPLVARLVTCSEYRKDLLKDQALPPRYAVVERAGRAVARFHGIEPAIKLAHILTPWHAVVRIEDGKAMNDVSIPRGWS